AYERVGDVRGGERGAGSLGDLEGTVESYKKALRIREALVALHPHDAQARRDLASSHRKLGELLRRTAEENNGLEHLWKALTLCLDLTREQPANDDLQLELADTRTMLGRSMMGRNDFAGALEQLSAAVSTCEKLVASNPRDQRYRLALWASHSSFG